MANKTMHHAVIGADTFELIDEAGREETASLKEDLSENVGDLKSAFKDFTYGEDNALADTGYFRKSHNLINPYTATPFSTLNYATGETSYNSGRNVSDFIPIDTANKYYVYADYARNICLYDANKEYVEGFHQASDFNTASNSMQLNQSDKYIRITFLRDYADNAYFCLREYSDIVESYGIKKATVTGAESLGSEVYSGLDAAIRGEAEKLYDKFDDYPTMSHSVNLFDKTGVHTKIVQDIYIDYTNGAVGSSESYATAYLPCTSGTTYFAKNSVFITFYTSDVDHANQNTFIQNTGLLNQNTFTAPNNAQTVALSIKKTSIDTYQVSVGSSEKPYEPYTDGIGGDEILPNTITNENLAPELKVKPIVDIGTGYDYTNLTLAVKEYKDVPVIFRLHKGTYDIYEEYKAVYGSDYFKNYETFYVGDYNAGLFLTKGQELIGDPLSKIVFTYDIDDPNDGGNANVGRYFSILNLSDDNVVKNIHFVGYGNCRYFIHDDFSDDNETVHGSNIIDHCYFEGLTISNTNPYIGSGMGKNRNYIYQNNYFNENIMAIGIHNNKNVTKNSLIIEGNYANGDMYIQCWGSSDVDTTVCMIMNNKYSTLHRIYVDATNYPNANMKVVQWNNIGTYSDET